MLCVNPGGTDGCYASIQAAVDAAVDGDTIQVAEGIYYETVELTKSLTLEGGWNPDFSARDWESHPTTIDAERNGPTIWVMAAVSPTVEGFVITGGDDTAHLGWGGGIKLYSGWHSPPEGRTVIRHNVITNNVACREDTCQGYGGGVVAYCTTALIEANTIISNAGRIGGTHGGGGGGVKIWSSEATLVGNTILSNTGVYSTSGLWDGAGGGVDTEYANHVVLIDNEIRGNVAVVKGTGYGGGMYGSFAELYGNQILSNTASFTGTGHGGGVYAYYVTGFDGNVVQGNVASQNGDGSGGGISALYLPDARQNTIIGNIATRGGGLHYESYAGRLALRGNTIARNRATGANSEDGGGGIASAADWISIVGNQIVSNTTGSAGGGVVIRQGTRYVLQDNEVISNAALVGGGIGVYSATGTIAHNQVISNRADAGGGMFLWGAANPTLDANAIMSNTAEGVSGSAGGGVLVNVDSGTALTLTNHIIARNAAGSGGWGGGVVCLQGDCVLTNNTIVDNDQGDHQEGVILAGIGAHTLWNNVIMGHSEGVILDSGTADLDYNDYYDNGTDVSGATAGPHHLTDDPTFEDRTGGDYHLALASPLVDQGDASVDVPFDFEGDPRPRGGGYDIGADEAYPAEVFVSVHKGSDVTGDGSPGDPFASVTKGLDGVRSGGTVYVGRGVYTERVTVTRGVNLLGGYDEGSWQRDIAAYGTTLDGAGTGTVMTLLGEGVEATVEGFMITGGEAGAPGGSGGGVVIGDGARGTLRHNTITGNHASNGGGGVLVWGDEGARSVIDSNWIFANTADGVFILPPLGAEEVNHPQQGPEPGGGLLVAGGACRVVNNMIYGNDSGYGGDGMALSDWGGAVEVFHNTVADNGGAGGVGIELRYLSAESALQNNLIVGHGTAISGTAQASWDTNGFYDNDADYGPGLSAGAHDVHGNPDFLDRGGGDYHISPGSVMAGRGSDAGVADDIDGDTRPAPAGSAPDLGADEVHWWRIFLPLVMRDS
jgi:hypothetical protein